MKSDNLRGDLTDIQAKKEPLDTAACAAAGMERRPRYESVCNESECTGSVSGG